MAIDRSALDALQDLIGGDPEDLRELVEDFIMEAPVLVDRVQDGAERGDTDAVRIAAHTLKSISRDLGAVDLAEISGTIETAAKEQRLDAGHRIEALQTALNDAISELKAL